jgi:hypothetical protein
MLPTLCHALCCDGQEWYVSLSLAPFHLATDDVQPLLAHRLFPFKFAEPRLSPFSSLQRLAIPHNDWATVRLYAKVSVGCGENGVRKITLLPVRARGFARSFRAPF